MRRTAAWLLPLVLVACGTRSVVSIRSTGDFLYDHGDYDGAAIEYGEIIDRYPGDWEANYKLGMCELKLGRLDGARRALEVAHTNNPTSSEITDALAETMYRQADDALFAFLQEQAEAEQTVESYLRLGRYAADLGDSDSALGAFETAIMLDEGQTVEPYLAAAVFAEEIGDMDAALRRLRQAYGIDARDQRITERLKALGEVPGPTIALPPGT